MTLTQPLLSMEDVSLSFGDVQVLRGVQFVAERGKVTALMGENGAGKSSLMKILTGINTHYTGNISWQGKPVTISSINQASELGISMIHQELSLLDNLTVAENIFLGSEPYSKSTRRIDKHKMQQDAQELLDYLESSIDVNALVGLLPIGSKQIVEFAKAVSRKSDIIIMDEPTTALTYVEAEHLFHVISKLKGEGLAIVYISHRLDEIFRVADNITVMRDGAYISSVPVADTNTQDLVEMIAGRKITNQYPYVEVDASKKVLLEVRDFGSNGLFEGVSLKVNSHTITGLSGLMGSGRTELANAIMGQIRIDTGTILVNGKAVRIRSPKEGIKHGIVMVPEDRKREGLVLGMSVKDNISLSSLSRYENKWGSLSLSREVKGVREYIDKLGIKVADISQSARSLSGGNQQKIVLAKCLLLDFDVIIVDEPTRGVDVGAKKDIYDILNELKRQGKGVLVISSDLPEVLGISDTIVVMSQGSIAGQFDHHDANQKNVMSLSLGVPQGEK